MNPLLSKAGPTDPVWTAYQGGRHIELDVERDGERVRLWIDGEQAVVYDEPLEQFRIGRSEVLVEVEIRSEAIKRAELVLGDERVALTPSGKDENRERSSGLVAKHGVEDRPDPSSSPFRLLQPPGPVITEDVASWSTPTRRLSMSVCG